MPKKLYAKRRITIQFYDENMNLVIHDLFYDDIFTDYAHSEFLKYLEENNNNLHSTLDGFCIYKGVNLEDLINGKLLLNLAYRNLQFNHTTNRLQDILYSNTTSFNVFKDNISMYKIFTHKYYNDQIFKIIDIQTLPKLLEDVNNMIIENDMIEHMLEHMLGHI